MQETVVIEILENNTTHVNCARFNAQSTLIDEAVNTLLTDVAPLTHDCYVIVLVPAEETVLLNVSLPPLNKQRLVQALPFAIEEYLLDDCKGLHIAPLLKEQVHEGSMPLLVVAHEKMQAWLQCLKEVGISPDLMTSTFFALPYQEKVMSLLLATPSLLRFGQYQGYVCDPHNIPVMLSQLLPFLGNNKVACYLLQGNACSLPALPETNMTLEHIDENERLRRMATFILTEKPINLLQDRYLVKKMRLPKGLLVQTILGLTIGWIVLLLLYPFVSYAILKSELITLNQRIAVIYKKYYPTARNFGKAKVQMEERIAQLTTVANENKLLLQLSFLGEALKNTPTVTIKQLTFTEQKMELEVTANAADEVTRFVEILTQKGLKVVQQNANLSNDKVSVNLLVE